MIFKLRRKAFNFGRVLHPRVQAAGHIFREETHRTAEFYHQIDKRIRTEIDRIYGSVRGRETEAGAGFTEAFQSVKGCIVGAGLRAFRQFLQEFKIAVTKH
jgi:hypothetical protein